MTNLSGLLFLTILMGLAACGGGAASEQPTPTQASLQPTTEEGGEQLTVGDYAEACGSVIEAFDSLESDDVREAFLTLEMRVTDLGKINPPDELKRFHDVSTVWTGFSVNTYREIGMIELLETAAALERDAANPSESEEWEQTLEFLERMDEVLLELEKYEAEAQKYIVEIEAAEAEFSPTTREILQAADCFSEDW